MIKFVRAALCSCALLQSADAFRSIGSSKKKLSKVEPKPIPADFETLLCNSIAAANFANPIREDRGIMGLKDGMEVLGAFAALDGVASMVVGLVAFSLSPEPDDYAKIANIMESVSHLVDDRLRVLKLDGLRDFIEDIHGRIKTAYKYPDRADEYWVGMHDKFADLMNNVYGGGDSSCWTNTGSNNCKEWRNDGKALMLAMEFTELIMTVSTEVHDYILSMPSSTVGERKSPARLDAIHELEKLGKDLEKATDLLSEHHQHFELRRREFDSPSHGVLAKVEDCGLYGQMAWHGGCELTGPYDQMTGKRICHDEKNASRQVNVAWLDHIKYDCQTGGPSHRRRAGSTGRGGCQQKGAKSWWCQNKGKKLWASCYQPRLDECKSGYKLAVEKDLQHLREKVDAVKKASAKVVTDASRRVVCVRQSQGMCYTTRRRRNSRRRRR